MIWQYRNWHTLYENLARSITMEDLFIKTTDELELTLKKIWHTDKLSFVGRLDLSTHPSELGYGYITKPVVNDRTIFYPSPVEKRAVSIRVRLSDEVSVGDYYRVSTKLAGIDLRREKSNPFLLIHDEQVPIIAENDHIPAEAFIRTWFYKKGHTPDDASTIAGQLRLNELELYTHTKRFIFELIQNADDMPFGRNEVNIEIFLLKNFLLFLHNGKFFDRNDVKAICDAAKSTKAVDITKTGYKGIGFKSVFTDSYRVFIKSADYFFKFDKLEPIYKDFWQLYKGYYESLNPDSKQKFEKEYRGKENDYLNIENIPWQIKPLWVTRKNAPPELMETPFFDNHQVAIALEVGEAVLCDKDKDYNRMIKELLQEPRFMLFLRNTKSFKYHQIEDSGYTNQLNISIKNRYGNMVVYDGEIELASYIKKDFDTKITNDDFRDSGLGFQRTIKDKKVVFNDLDGKPLDNIPEKIAHLDQTAISFAAKLDRSHIVNLQKEESILFNYLPTSDKRFGFPFLVNADFVCKTDREFIQIENKWNHFLLYQIGFKCIEWISELGMATYLKDGKVLNKYAASYLSLLPDDLLPEDNIEQGSANRYFNNGLKKAVTSLAFILDTKGNLRKCSEIILDETGLFTLLGGPGINLFEEIVHLNKRLPLKVLDQSKLGLEYLDIEKFTSKQLIALLEEVENKNFLADTLLRVDQKSYASYLKWLDGFIKINEISNSWLFDMPLLIISNNVSSFNQAIVKEDFLFKTQKTKGIEPILKKLGYMLSEFYIDEFVHLATYTNQVESYLNKDLKIYERISMNQKLGLLTPSEKNELLTFVKTLTQVGETAYAKTLPLFKSKIEGQSLRPLAQLISNQCEELPSWLDKLVIDHQEEKELSSEFSKYLVQKDKLFTEVFCNLQLFGEVTAGLKEDEVLSFYTLLKQAHSDILENDNITYTGIPWLFVPKTNTFQLPAMVYCPESFYDLGIDKYGSIKLILEYCSDCILPHFASLPFVKLFSLGCKHDAASTLINRSGTFSLGALKDFLDWILAKSEKDFFKKCRFTKSADSNYVMCLSGDLVQYYSPDDALNKTITASDDVSGILSPLPVELYIEGLKGVGLLEGSDLIKFILDKGRPSISFVLFIHGKVTPEIKKLFIEKLGNINLTSGVIYNKESHEHKIIDIVLELGKADEAYFDLVIPNISIDENSISSRNISDDVFFQIKRQEIECKYELSLSSILPGYQDQTSSVTSIVEAFPDHNKTDLRKLFKLSNKKHRKIFDEIHASSIEYLKPAQVLFLWLFFEETNQPNIFGNKIGFAKYFWEKDQSLYEKSLIEFLDLCFQKNYLFFVKSFTLTGFTPGNIVLDADYSLLMERIPWWLNNWVNASESDKKLNFLNNIGFNGHESFVIKLRKSLIDKNKDEFTKYLSNLDNDILVKNTIHWLNEQKVSPGFILESLFLKPLYERLASKSVLLKDLLIPVITEYSEDRCIYSLKVFDPLAEYHFMHSGWGDFKNEILKYLLSNSKQIIDDVIPQKYITELKIINTSPVKKPDEKNLLKNSSPFNEPFYSEWAQKDIYKIRIYEGNLLPYNIYYNDFILNTLTEGNREKVNEIFYVSADEEYYIPYSLKGMLPDPIRFQLDERKTEYEKKKNRSKYAIEYSESEQQALMRLFGDEIPRGYHKDLNLVSMIKALIYLHDQGYQVSDAEANIHSTQKFAQLFPVYPHGQSKTASNEITVKCRSAKTGLLYLRASTWEELADSNTYLYILTGNKNNDCRLCKTRTEILEDKKADYQIFRIEASSNPDTIDSILDGNFDKSSIRLVIRVGENNVYKSIFEKIRKKEENDDSGNINLGDETID